MLTLLKNTCVLLLTGLLGIASPVRERLNLDEDWTFSLGSAVSPSKDFNHATAYFSYLAKAGAGDGPATPSVLPLGWQPTPAFDDSGWRRLDLPHDWAVELPFSPSGSHSHGFKALGPRHPENNVGWYRKRIQIPRTDEGRRVSVVFDGVYRDARFWFNGYYLGQEPSGYSGSRFDVTDYLDYGAENYLVVRVDATMEEGWFYEGAGIYRHVWLEKTSSLHIAPDGVFVRTDLEEADADAKVLTSIVNEGDEAEFVVQQQVFTPSGELLAQTQSVPQRLRLGGTVELTQSLRLSKPQLWSLDSPQLHVLRTLVCIGGRIIDCKETRFGVRSLRFDPNKGFFLNGRHVFLKGTNNHQDHAGVGVALPDALQEYRIRRLKEMGSNAYRCSHNPPTPELLDACDRLGMLVIDETRLMGSNPAQLDYLERMVRRDRNHPSVILWSIGNEEWLIEGTVKGRRIAATMQALVHRLDDSRPVTAGVSGGWGKGISTVVDVMGYNYIAHGDIDRHHQEFPWQAGLGSEETTTQGTRGIYFENPSRGHLPPQKEGNSGGNAELGLRYYMARPFLAGIFFWTGFDYRGEPTPYGYPSVASQFGIMDTCGFPKDSFHYLKSWWSDEPVLHLSPHWNWPGREGQKITVVVNSNVEEVELLLNGRSQGRKTMERLGHLEWDVEYAPGKLSARGFTNGKLVLEQSRHTTGPVAELCLTADRRALKATSMDLVVVTVSASDAEGHAVPDAGNLVEFELDGPGRILGVGNGDPSSLEPDKCLPEREGTAPYWQRRLFNGLAQVLVQTEGVDGEIVLRAKSEGLRSTELRMTIDKP